MSYKGSGPPSRTGSNTSRTGRCNNATCSRLTVQPKTSVTKIQATVIQKTASATRIQSQSKLTSTTTGKCPAKPCGSRQEYDGSTGLPVGSTRIRMAAKTTKDSKSSIQTTKVVVTGTGLKPTGKVDAKICKAKCAKKTAADPLLQPFTEDVERGRPVPAGMYYIPISGAPDQGLGPDEKKLRTKLQKFTPTALSHWKVESNDPFARKVGPLKAAHPDIISGQFRAAQGPYEPEYANPQLEQRLDPSMPEEYWSICLREAMSHESGVYELENPDNEQKEQFTVENTVIERQIDTDLPGSGEHSRSGTCRGPSPRSGAHPTPSPVPCEPSSSSARARQTPSPLPCEPPSSSARARQTPSPVPCGRPGLKPQATHPPCKAKCSNLHQSIPAITIQPPTPENPCQRTSGHPEIEHTVDVKMVPAPRMQSPVGEIDAQKTIYLQRLLQASPQGTKVVTTVKGTNLLSPCQAKQINITKQDNLPPPSPPRPLSPQVWSPHRPITPQLQYVMPPRDTRYSPQMYPSSGYPLPGPYASPPPSPFLTHRGVSPQGYTPPMYGMMAQQRSPVPTSRMSPAAVMSPRSPFIQPTVSGQRAVGYGRSPCQQPPSSAQGRSPYLQVPGAGTETVTPKKISSPIQLDAAAPVPHSPADASLDIVRRLVDEERQDVVFSQELPPSLSRKLNKLKKKPQSMRVLEETLDQSVPIDEETETLKSDVIAELMYSQETGVINPASSPRKTYEQLFPPLEDEQQIAVSPAAPAPLHDIVVPVGEATIDSVAVVNEEISEAVAESTDEIPEANAFAEALKNDTEGQLTSPSPPREHRSSREEEEEATEPAEYIPRGELEEQKAPWDINLGSLEDLVGGKMSISAWDNLPSDESLRATAGRLEYVLDVQKPLHHSCVQLRGSQMPAWFPGFYSVLPQVDGFVRLERTPSRAFASAWHVFAPYQSAEQSEVVIL